MAPFFRICISAVVFYSTFLALKCQDRENPGRRLHDYRTEIPGDPPYHFDAEKHNFAFMAWIAVLSVVISVAVIVMICCLCWKLYPKYASRRQSSCTTLVSSANSDSTVTSPANQNGDIELRNTRLENVYDSGFVSIPFSNFPNNSSNLPLDDGPPAYTVVFSEAPPGLKTTCVKYPHLGEGVNVETPPPAYMTVDPFQEKPETEQI